MEGVPREQEKEGEKALWEQPWGASTTTAELDLNTFLPDDAGAAAEQALRGDVGPTNKKKVVYLFGVKVEYTDDETIRGGGCCDKGVDAAPPQPLKKRKSKFRRRHEARQRHWEDKYAQVKAWAAEHGGQLAQIPITDPLRNWLDYWGGRGWRRLDREERDKLTALGIARPSRRNRQKRDEEPTTTTTTMTTMTTTTATTTTTTATTTMVPPPKPRKKYTTWAARFEELRQYRELHGDLPDQHESPLGAWLHNQRYRINTGRMTNEDKIAKLTTLGIALLPPSMIPELEI